MQLEVRRMKRAALLAFLTLGAVLCSVSQSDAQRRISLYPLRPGQVPANFPSMEPSPDFPLRVHLLTARFGGSSGVYHGYGSGNLLDANGAQGFDYGFECDVPFVANESSSDFYQARWKGSPYKLEILTAEVGVAQPREHTCILRVAMEQRPFEPLNTATLSHGISSSLRKRWQDPDFTYEQPEPDYPVHFHVVDGQRTEDDFADHGWGAANLSDPTGQTDVMGADFAYTCSYGFITNAQIASFYQARWVNMGSEIEVLLQRPGSDKVEKCRVQLTLKPQPYPESHHIAVDKQATPTHASVQAPSGTP
jgi:hypothetical protein